MCRAPALQTPVTPVMPASGFVFVFGPGPGRSGSWVWAVWGVGYVGQLQGRFMEVSSQLPVTVCTYSDCLYSIVMARKREKRRILDLGASGALVCFRVAARCAGTPPPSSRDGREADLGPRLGHTHGQPLQCRCSRRALAVGALALEDNEDRCSVAERHESPHGPQAGGGAGQEAEGRNDHAACPSVARARECTAAARARAGLARHVAARPRPPRR